MKPEDQAIEDYIDKHGLQHLLTLIELICLEKADHIRASYGDKQLERSWRSASSTVENCARHSAVEKVS